LKLKLVAISLLVALTAWIFIWPAKTAAQQTKTEYQNKQPESVIYKTDVPSGPIESNKPVLPSTKKAVSKSPAPPVSTGYSGRDYSKSEIEALIRGYSKQYGVDENLTTRIAYCESGYNQYSKNKSSTASGVFQYLLSTWGNTEAGKSGISPFDADANVRMAVSSIAAHGTAPWLASKNCWSK